jgi:hypothetical protein
MSGEIVKPISANLISLPTFSVTRMNKYVGHPFLRAECATPSTP